MNEMDERYYLDNLKVYFPSIYKSMVNAYVKNPNELIVETEDGERHLFNPLTQTIRKLPTRKDHYTQEEFLNEFGMRMFEIMERKHITQEELSRRTGIAQPRLSLYMNGQSSPSFYYADKIAKGLECAIDDLMI